MHSYCSLYCHSLNTVQQKAGHLRPQDLSLTGLAWAATDQRLVSVSATHVCVWAAVRPTASSSLQAESLLLLLSSSIPHLISPGQLTNQAAPEALTACAAFVQLKDCLLHAWLALSSGRIAMLSMADPSRQPSSRPTASPKCSALQQHQVCRGPFCTWHAHVSQ